MSDRVVLDASVLLAIVCGEPGEERALALLADALVSAVNLSEAAAKMTELGFGERHTETLLGALGLTLRAFGEGDAYSAGRLRRSTRAAGHSFGDRACLALALREAVPVATADRSWQALDLGVAVEVVR